MPKTPESEFPVETFLPTGVRILTYRRAPESFDTAAVFRGKLLNLLTSKSPIQAGRMHRLLVESWGAASEGNLIDDADAPGAAQ